MPDNRFYGDDAYHENRRVGKSEWTDKVRREYQEGKVVGKQGKLFDFKTNIENLNRIHPENVERFGFPEDD